jgi:tetratricopeptide (TPR) repeat protein
VAKIIQFKVNPVPEKFGPQPARHKKQPQGKRRELEKPGQLNLFTGGKIVRLNQLTVFEEALMLDDQGDKTAAKNRYLKAIEEHDSVADAYCNLGILEFKEAQNTKAIDFFTKCLKEEPRHFEAHYNLANLYAEVGNFALAKVHYEVSIEIEPTFPNSHFNLGLTLAMNKEFPQAIQALKHYRQLTPQSEHSQVDELILKLSSSVVG